MTSADLRLYRRFSPLVAPYRCRFGLALILSTARPLLSAARISLSERSRELATLRVIGFTRTEISAILLGEIGVLTLIAIPVGLAAGYGLAALTVLGLDTEVFRVPLIINLSTFGFAASVVVVARSCGGLAGS